jgi:hypothetical protein
MTVDDHPKTCVGDLYKEACQHTYIMQCFNSEEKWGKKGKTSWGKRRLGGERREKQERDGKDQGEGEGKIGRGKDRVRRGQ